MKLIKNILLILVIINFTNCKKDYPNNTPKWIKNKIKECKNGNCCYDGLGMIITEYTNTIDNSKIYVFEKYTSLACDEYYDEKGMQICLYNIANCPGDSCGNIPLNKLVFSREIWRENSDKCK